MKLANLHLKTIRAGQQRFGEQGDFRVEFDSKEYVYGNPYDLKKSDIRKMIKQAFFNELEGRKLSGSYPNYLID